MSYQRADAVTVLSADLRDNLVAKVDPRHRSKIRVIPNFVDTAQIAPQPDDTEYRRQLGVEGRTVVMYAGNVGFSQSFDLIVHAARQWRERSDVVFVINGNGSARPSLEEDVRDLPNVVFGDFQPRDRL